VRKLTSGAEGSQSLPLRNVFLGNRKRTRSPCLAGTTARAFMPASSLDERRIAGEAAPAARRRKGGPGVYGRQVPLGVRPDLLVLPFKGAEPSGSPKELGGVVAG
jgi:hypothetical protein